VEAPTREPLDIEDSNPVLDIQEETGPSGLFSEVNTRVDLEEVMADMMQDLYSGCV
jgi:hypothetical protein